MSEQHRRPGFPSRDQLFRKHSAGREVDAFRKFAPEIEARARAATNGSPEAAYAWLAKNKQSLMSEASPFGPGYLDFASALGFASECLYWEAVESPMDPHLVERYSAEYRSRAFSEGRDDKAALEWLSSNMIAIGQENIVLHADWKERNTAYGQVRKKLVLSLLHDTPHPHHKPQSRLALPDDPSSHGNLSRAIKSAVSTSPGSTDRELTNRLVGKGAPQQRVNAICRALAAKGVLVRRNRADGLIGNFPSDLPSSASPLPPEPLDSAGSAAIDVLRQLGFEEAGHWRIRAGRPYFRLESHHQLSDVLYAFVADTAVMYVGKTATALETRMRAYRMPGPTQRTNLRVRAHMSRLLARGDTLAIWVMLHDPLTYRGFKVSLAAGLEDAVIQATRPQWNLLVRRAQ